MKKNTVASVESKKTWKIIWIKKNGSFNMSLYNGRKTLQIHLSEEKVWKLVKHLHVSSPRGLIGCTFPRASEDPLEDLKCCLTD